MEHDTDLLPALPGRWRRRQLIVLDCVAAVGYTLALLTLTVGQAARAGGQPQPAQSLGWQAVVAVAAIGLPLAVRRLWPRTVFAAVLASSMLSTFLGLARDPFVAAGLALYLVATTSPRRRREPTLLVSALSVTGIVLVSVGTPAGTDGRIPSWWQEEAGRLLFGAMVLGVAWTIGRAVRERRRYVARTAGQLAEQAVTEERLRIARELHDVVAHSMSLIAVKASTANHVFGVRPEEAGRALAVIESTSRTALTEMRHLLGVLRTGSGGGELSPAPGPSGLAGAADRARQAGVQVELTVEGIEDLPEGVGLSVYRIVQEALTNVIKHAAPTRCRIQVAAGAREVSVTVSDDGPDDRIDGEGHTLSGRPEGHGGHGLIGMRERVAMYGGEFSAGPRPGGGFEVTARWEFR